MRELREEIDTSRADVLAESRGWFYHDVPDEIAQGIMGGHYRGNRQKWLAMRFAGTDADINLATEHPEFDAWQWVRPERLPSSSCRLCAGFISTFWPNSARFGQHMAHRKE